MLFDAVVREIEIIGEAVNNISDKLRKAHPGVQWNLMVGMRNFLIHEYFEVDLEVVWDTVKNSLPELKEQIQKII